MAPKMQKPAKTQKPAWLNIVYGENIMDVHNPSCFECQKKFRTVEKLVSHLQQHHGLHKAHLKNSYLGKVLFQEQHQELPALAPEELATVDVVEGDDTKFLCKECEKVYSKTYSYKHFRDGHGLPPDYFKNWNVVRDGQALSNDNENLHEFLSAALKAATSVAEDNNAAGSADAAEIGNEGKQWGEGSIKGIACSPPSLLLPSLFLSFSSPPEGGDEDWPAAEAGVDIYI